MSEQAESTALVDDLIRAAAHLEPELEEALAEHGLTRPSFLVLTTLLDAPEHRLSQRDLMAGVQRTSGTLSVRLARLERAGYVARERDPDDRRGAIVTLTDRGRERAEAARPAYAETAARLAAGLPNGERDAGTCRREPTCHTEWTRASRADAEPARADATATWRIR